MRHYSAGSFWDLLSLRPLQAAGRKEDVKLMSVTELVVGAAGVLGFARLWSLCEVCEAQTPCVVSRTQTLVTMRDEQTSGMEAIIVPQ